MCVCIFVFLQMRTGMGAQVSVGMVRWRQRRVAIGKLSIFVAMHRYEEGKEGGGEEYGHQFLDFSL